MKSALAIGAMGMVLVAAVRAQEPRQGPVTPPPGREIKRAPTTPPDPPPVPVDEIIQRFTQKEAEMKRAHEQFNYRMTVRVQEFGEDGSAAGEWQVVSDVVFKPDGSRVGRILQEPASTLKRTDFALEDLQELASLPQFILTPDQRERYEIIYQGTQPIDELNAYIFQVRPKRLERRVPQFEGLVWVEDRDFAVVRTYGRMVTEVSDDTKGMPFKNYETYRENIESKYWFPAFTRSEETLKTHAGETKLRLTIRCAEFRPRETK